MSSCSCGIVQSHKSRSKHTSASASVINIQYSIFRPTVVSTVDNSRPRIEAMTHIFELRYSITGSCLVIICMHLIFSFFSQKEHNSKSNKMVLIAEVITTQMHLLLLTLSMSFNFYLSLQRLTEKDVYMVFAWWWCEKDNGSLTSFGRPQSSHQVLTTSTCGFDKLHDSDWLFQSAIFQRWKWVRIHFVSLGPSASSIITSFYLLPFAFFDISSGVARRFLPVTSLWSSVSNLQIFK